MGLHLRYVIAIIVVICSTVGLAIWQADWKDELEFSNNATLVAEIGIGIIITLVVLMLSRDHEDRIKTIMGIVESDKKTKDERLRQIYGRLDLMLESEMGWLDHLIQQVSLINDNQEPIQKSMKNHIGSQMTRIKHFSKKTFVNSNYVNNTSFDLNEIITFDEIDDRLNFEIVETNNMFSIAHLREALNHIKDIRPLVQEKFRKIANDGQKIEDYHSASLKKLVASSSGEIE